jgi:hypothetical protein
MAVYDVNAGTPGWDPDDDQMDALREAFDGGTLADLGRWEQISHTFGFLVLRGRLEAEDQAHAGELAREALLALLEAAGIDPKPLPSPLAMAELAHEG